MARLDEDLLAVLLAVATGTLGERGPVKWRDAAALTVVMAAKGYPGTPETGVPINGIAAAEAKGATVFQAGTRLDDGQIVTSGGRVLAVTATGPTIADAQADAYRALTAIDFPGGFYRNDIGWREIERDAG